LQTWGAAVFLVTIRMCAFPLLFSHIVAELFRTRNWAGRGRLFLISTFSLPVKSHETKTAKPLKEPRYFMPSQYEWAMVQYGHYQIG